ncbi:right-handed parallel beta-helix repeat-containing protein [Sphingobacterium sp. Ag1]|uniref:right-handed parallel beta-helix repeat-containing protein n=1 Tax=Sphingobacterium sp. Ag1 TaxID=1643451 RepID=UPI00069BFC7D|nr:right-handed parallel beta-helix repeat-containing protein [Sphingobacterium sp. Ag1]
MKYYHKIVGIMLCCVISQRSLYGQKQSSYKEIHVSQEGSDINNGAQSSPLKSIQAASKIAQPGDVITVHEGIYRECVSPPRGGESAQKMIRYQAAAGERVEIKGSEVIKGWKHIDRNTWMVSIPNAFFGTFNPYADTIHGDWLERGKWCHTGEVYLNNIPLRESETLENMLLAKADKALWFAKVDEKEIRIWANFIAANPNENTVEINVRQAVFYPEKPYINYIHVKGFMMSHAATPWAPPTAEQIGLLGTHWSKGWLIEDNTISHSKCVGITLGKYGDAWDNKSESAEAFVKTTERALENNWNRDHIGSHIVRNNRISFCGQAGIAGSLGAIYSVIADNIISDIGLNQQFWGYEVAGLKLHAPVDVVIRHNHIYRTEGGIWLDWMTQGTRITNNLLHDNKVQDFSLEVNHGPVLVDNNLFLSEELAQVKLSQGIAFINNLIAWKIWPTGKVDERKTPYLTPHSTEIAGLHDCPCGDVSYYNNLFTRADLTVYDECPLTVKMKGNLFLAGAAPAKSEVEPQVDPVSDTNIKVVEEADGWYLYMNVSSDWKTNKNRMPVFAQELGNAAIPQQRIASAAEALKSFNIDYFGNTRKNKHHYPGPIEFRKNGMQKIKVY